MFSLNAIPKELGHACEILDGDGHKLCGNYRTTIINMAIA
jgi:hypothetical protein